MSALWTKTRAFVGSPAAVIVAGSMLVLVAATFATVLWPVYTMKHKPSSLWRPNRTLEDEGRLRYIANGCTYCHSQYVRPQDWGIGAERIAESGDYHQQQPHLLGSERTGPDLSQEGGEHSDDWHLAHFINPRFTRPRSLMPRFAFEGDRNIKALVAYMQSLGGKNADARVAAQKRFHAEAIAAYRKGPDENIEWLHSRVPRSWRAMPTESPVTDASVARGEKVYQDYCIGCHGPVGDGEGPAARYLEPRPVNFTTLRRHLIDRKYIGGILYYQIMNGITGTAMPYFKKDLESAKIWDVSNYLERNFIGHTDDKYPDVGIPASYEGKEAGPVTDQPAPEPPSRSVAP
ncbi:MAG: cbb3-type cytochrome c oxidase subunit II [Armatimonadota bacterium]|nr:cbb3-type cytochrome c oxidase subunit II [Armatimonadota bacterium]